MRARSLTLSSVHPIAVRRRESWAWLLVLFLSIASFQPLLAQSPDPIAITPDPSFHESITRSVEIAIDPSLEWTAPDIVNGEGDFVSFTEPYLDAGLTDARVWLRFELRNTSQRSGPWRVDIQRQYTKEIRLFMVQDGVIEELLSSSDDLPFDARKFPNRFLQAEFDLAPGETAQFLIGYRSSSTTFLPVFIGAPDAARYDHAVEERIDWLINGALFAMVVLSLLLTPLIGWRLSLSFSAYICAGLLYVGNADAYTFEFLWPQTPWLNDPMNLVTILLMAAGAMNFGRQLFVFRKVAPRFDKLLLGFTLLALTTSLLVLPFYEIRPFMIVAYCIVPVGASLQFVCGIVAIRLGRVGAWPFTFGALLVFSSFVYATIAHLLPGQFDLDNTLDYGHMVLLADSMAFAVAIMLRIVALRQERDDALEDSLAAAEEEARLNKALLQSQTDYWETRKLADARLSRLADVSHDIRQPLYSLRKSLGAMRGQDETVTEQMQAAFDYLESIAIAQPEGTQVEATAEGGRDTEAFPINAVLDNVHAIFVSQAEQAGKTLGYKPSSHQIETNPIVLMRIVSNLVSNAIKHGGDDILMAAQMRGETVSIEICDDGPGIEADELDRILQRGEKGERSSGEGLGLAIVAEHARDLGLGFELLSPPNGGSEELQGTLARIIVPLAPA